MGDRPSIWSTTSETSARSLSTWSQGIKVKQMIYIAVLINPKITAEPLYNTPLFIGPYAAANNTALLAWRPSQGTKLYCLVNRGTLCVNNLPRVVARIMPRSESNPRPLDQESNSLPLHYRVTSPDGSLYKPVTWWIGHCTVITLPTKQGECASWSGAG